jgi:predicted nucleic acid-binding protein
VLLKAKEAGLIPSIRPKLETLRSLPFHISPRLLEDILSQARE